LIIVFLPLIYNKQILRLTPFLHFTSYACEFRLNQPWIIKMNLKLIFWFPWTGIRWT